MAGIQDHDYLRLCADLARRLGVSQRQHDAVEMAAAKEGLRDVEARMQIATQLIDETREEQNAAECSIHQPDALLAASPEDENFMLED